MEDAVKEKPVLDKADLMERLDDDHELAVELAMLFISDVREKLVSLGDAVNSGLGPEIEKEAHSLKGSASNLSAERIRYIAGLIEVAAKNNDMGTVLSCHRMIRPSIDELIEVLRADIISPFG